jgi:LmbE family N-acetylglucosaminyl deacetylase
MRVEVEVADNDPENKTDSAAGKTLLACFAHPDDEVFGSGGTLARYAAEGARVILVCATAGEVGEISDPILASPENLGEVRREELRCSAQHLGVSEVVLLGYRDSGMAGTPDNDNPRAFAKAPSEEVVSRLVGIMRDLKPEVVVTFEPGGGYGHPDHMAIHHHTVAAFVAAGDAKQFPEQGPAWQPSRLFYTAIPRSFFLEMRDRLREMGIDTSDFARFEEAGAGWPDEKVNVTLDISAFIDAKWTALHCHRTQLSPDNLFLKVPEQVIKQGFSREHFALAIPEPQPGERLSGLFTNSGADGPDNSPAV